MGFLHTTSCWNLACPWCFSATSTQCRVFVMAPNSSSKKPMPIKFWNAARLDQVNLCSFQGSYSPHRRMSIPLSGNADSFPSSQLSPLRSTSHKVIIVFWIESEVIDLIYRTNSEQYWDLAQISSFCSWAALCCCLQSRRSKQSEICLNEEQRW